MGNYRPHSIRKGNVGCTCFINKLLIENTKWQEVVDDNLEVHNYINAPKHQLEDQNKS